MVKPTKPPANAFVSAMRRLYNPLGFAKGYNFVFWFITMGSVSLHSLNHLCKNRVLIHPGISSVSH